MDRDVRDVNLESHTINSWYFAPYKHLEEYSSEDPLYGLVAEFDSIGDVMVYNRSGEIGTYHSIDPTHESVSYHPPTESFRTAITLIFDNPGEKQDISTLTAKMKPWEHHQLATIVTGVNNDFDALPKEIISLIRMHMDEKMDIEVSEKEEAQKSEHMKLTKNIADALSDTF